MAGIEIVDLDGDGSNEIVAGASAPGSGSANDHWSVFSRATDGTYAQIYASELYQSTVTCLRIVDYDGNGRPDVAIASGNTIFVYDGVTKAAICKIVTTAVSIQGLCFDDVDSDGHKEFIFCDSAALYVYDATTGFQERRLAGFGGVYVAVGNVDGDSHREIVIGNNLSTGYVLDGMSGASKWTKPTGFGNRIKLWDIDQDGIDEIITETDIDIFAYNGDSQSQIWNLHAPTNYFHGLALKDLNNDGILDLSFVNQDILASLRASDGAFEWSVFLPYQNVPDIAAGNLDPDPAQELVFCTGLGSSGQDYLYVYDGITHLQEWRSTSLEGPVTAFDSADVDGDGSPDFVPAFAYTDMALKDGRWFVYDVKSHALKYSSGNQTGNSKNGLTRIRCANVDADPQSEVFVVASINPAGLVICYDGVTHAEQFRTTPISSQRVCGLLVKDVDGDGLLDIIVSSGRVSSGAAGSFLYIHNGQTGALKWQSPTTLGTYSSNLDFVRVANVDSDPNMEIIVGENGGAIWVFDGVTHVMQMAALDLDTKSLETADLNGDGVQEIIVGDVNGNVTVRDPATGNVVQTLGNFGAQVDGLRIADVVGDPSPDLIFAKNGYLQIVYKDFAGLIRTWSSALLAPNSGSQDSIEVGDFNHNGVPEIEIAERGYGIVAYEVRRSKPIHPD